MSRFPVAFRLPAFASRSSDARRGVGPSLRSAYRAKPPARTSTGLPRSARVSSDRGGCPLDPGDGGAPPEPSGVPGRRLPLPSGQSLNPSSSNPSTGVHFTRHQRGFKQFTRPAIPLACGRSDGTSRRLGFPPGLRTPPTRSRRRTPGWGQAIEHGPGTTRSTSHQPILQSCSSLTTCDLASHIDTQRSRLTVPFRRSSTASAARRWRDPLCLARTNFTTAGQAPPLRGKQRRRRIGRRPSSSVVLLATSRAPP